MKTRLCLLLISCLAASLHAEQVDLASTASFHGTSTLHAFSGHGESKPADAEWIPNEKGGVLTAENISFDVKSLSTDHGKRDRNMMKMFEPETFPALVGSVDAWTLDDTAETENRLTLRIHGKTITVPAKVTAFERTAEGGRFTTAFTLSLKACGLQRPSVLGLIRVGDEVRVSVDTRIRPSEETP